MAFDLVRRPKRDVNSASVGLPAWRVRRCKSLVGIRNAPVMFKPDVPDRAGIRSSAQPELLDELVCLWNCPKVIEGHALLVSGDIGHILVDPLVVRGRQR